MKRIAIVGCGGIVSWFTQHLKEVTEIYDKKELLYIKLFDNDEVEEKNIIRSSQNFTVDDLTEQKAETLAKRYGFEFENVFITEENLSELDIFDDIILGVDNHKVRRLLYDYALKKNKYLLDMRAQGTRVSFYILDHDKDMKYYDEKYFNNEITMEKKGSCQLKKDIEDDHIENGNKLIAYMGAYCIYLKRLRNEEVSTNEWKWVY